MLNFHADFLRRLHAAGIRAEDYKYADLYRDFEAMREAGDKVTYAVTVLAERYQVSERQVYLLIKRFERTIDSNIIAVT